MAQLPNYQSVRIPAFFQLRNKSQKKDTLVWPK